MVSQQCKGGRTQEAQDAEEFVFLPLVLFVLLVFVPLCAFAQSPQQALINQYCVTCHNQRAKTANVMFDTMDVNDVSKNPQIWERAVRKLRGE